MLFGMPQRLSNAIGRARVRLETTMRLNPHDTEAKAKLDILMLAYSVTSRASKNHLAQEMEAAYKSAKHKAIDPYGR
jgi:hypothetical protein